MPIPIGKFDVSQQICLLLRSIQENDREKVLVQLMEIGLWLSAAPRPLPAPQLNAVSLAALDATVRELRVSIQQHRAAAAKLAERDSNSIASVIEHNSDLLESVTDALAALGRHKGFLVQQG